MTQEQNEKPQFETLNSEGDVVPIGPEGVEPIDIDDSLPNDQKYGIALKITDPKLAKQYFEACVRQTMKAGRGRREAETIEKVNIAFFAAKVGQEKSDDIAKLYGIKK